jgi:hypothetical protein
MLHSQVISIPSAPGGAVSDLFDFNHGGATHPGARAIVHPAADCDKHTVWYRVTGEGEEHITLDDGYAYDKRTGAVCGPAGRPILQNRRVATEGSAMFACWSRTAEDPGHQRPQVMPVRGRANFLKRLNTAFLRFLRRG